MIPGLHNIEEVDPAPIWPLAIGWWVLIACGLLAIGYFCYRIKRMRSWQAYTRKYLIQLEKNLTAENAKETVEKLSEYLRRIALKRYSRETCAGLRGEEWLKWLKEKDTKGFDWGTKGRLLIQIPYAPPSISVSVEHVKELICAVKGWVQ